MHITHLLLSLTTEADISSIGFKSWSVPNLSSSALYSSASFCNSQFIERTQLKHFFLCVESISSNVVLRDCLMRGVLVLTSIPSETGYTHAATSPLAPVASTRHIRHDPTHCTSFK